MIIESVGKEQIVTIHYEGWNMWYDELLPITKEPKTINFCKNWSH